MSRRVEVHRLRRRHDLVDPAETVDGDLLNEQLHLGVEVFTPFFSRAFFFHQCVHLHVDPSLHQSARFEGAFGATVKRACETERVSSLVPPAPSPVDLPVVAGTAVRLDERAVFIDRNLVAGGSPWRLLRLAGPSREVVERWRLGGCVEPGEGRLARTLITQGLLHPITTDEVDVGDVEVVVPLRDDSTSLSALLSQLNGFRVTVVDDASMDGEAVTRVAERAGADLLRLDRNLGPGGARNAGARRGAGAFIWFIDADVTLVNPENVAKRLRSAFSDPLVAAVAPRVRGADDPGWREGFERRFGPLDQGPKPSLVVAGASVSFVPGACLMVRREAFGDGFDDSLRVGEDVDFVWRLTDAGWLVRYDAATVVAHRARKTWPAWWRQRHLYGRSSAALAIRHGRRVAPLRADAWTVIAWALVAAGRPALAWRVVHAAQRHARTTTFASTLNPDDVAREVVTRHMLSAGGPLARAVVRTFGVAVLAAALHPRLRRGALGLFALGTLWRWRHDRLRVADVPLGVADDLAYGTGVVVGAWRARSWRAVLPDITRPTMSLREVIGLAGRGTRPPRLT